MVGSALMRRLEAEAFSNVVTRERSQLDLTDESAVAKFFDGRKTGRSSLSQRQKLAGSKRTTIIPSNFSSRICGFRTTSSARPTTTACANCFFLEAPAFIQSSRRNRSRKARCSLARWNRRTKRTQSRRLPESSFARHFLANTGRTLSRRCRRIFTGRTTISIWRLHTCWRRSCARRTKPKCATIEN